MRPALRRRRDRNCTRSACPCRGLCKIDMRGRSSARLLDRLSAEGGISRRQTRIRDFRGMALPWGLRLPGLVLRADHRSPDPLLRGPGRPPEAAVRRRRRRLLVVAASPLLGVVQIAVGVFLVVAMFANWSQRGDAGSWEDAHPHGAGAHPIKPARPCRWTWPTLRIRRGASSSTRSCGDPALQARACWPR